MKKLDIVSTTLIIIGALNWGLVGLFSFDLVSFVFGEMSFLTRFVYVLVGVSAVYEITRVKEIFHHGHQGI